MSFPPDYSDYDIVGSTWERVYYKKDIYFMKRSLRPDEYHTGELGLHVPRAAWAKLQNEAVSLRFIAEKTDIPVPKLYSASEHKGAYCLIMQYVEGVKMKDLKPEQKKVVIKEIESHLASLHNQTSNKLGGPGGHVIPPHRVTTRTKNDSWKLQSSIRAEYVFCHNDLSQQNIIVNPDTLKIQAIIDWEFAGFYPGFFEMPLYRRLDGNPGSKARHDEIDDTDDLLKFLEGNIVRD